MTFSFFDWIVRRSRCRPPCTMTHHFLLQNKSHREWLMNTNRHSIESHTTATAHIHFAIFTTTRCEHHIHFGRTRLVHRLLDIEQTFETECVQAVEHPWIVQRAMANVTFEFIVERNGLAFRNVECARVRSGWASNVRQRGHGMIFVVGAQMKLRTRHTVFASASRFSYAIATRREHFTFVHFHRTPDRSSVRQYQRRIHTRRGGVIVDFDGY